MKNIPILILATAILAACGGSGGGSAPAATTVTTSGVAAVGAPIVGGAVALKCASGATASATTAADGGWSVNLLETDYPCAARVSGGTANGTANTLILHSVALGAGRTNITTLTDLIVARLAGRDPGTWFDSVSGSGLKDGVTASALSTARNSLVTILASVPGGPVLTNDVDPLTVAFKAEAGDPFDALLEQYAQALGNAGASHAQVAVNIGYDQPLDESHTYAHIFTYPASTPSRTAILKLTGTEGAPEIILTIPDARRGDEVLNVAFGNPHVVTTVSGSGDIKEVLLGEAPAGMLCAQNAAGLKGRYVFVVSELAEVTDLDELKGRSFQDFEDCAPSGSTSFNADGTMTVSYQGGASETEPADTVARLFSSAGDTKAGKTVKAKAYRFDTGSGAYYVYVKVGSATPFVNDSTGDNFVSLGLNIIN